VRERVEEGDAARDRDDRLDVDSLQVAIAAGGIEQGADVDLPPLPDQLVGLDDTRQRRGDVPEVRDPCLSLLDERREGGERHCRRGGEDGRA